MLSQNEGVLVGDFSENYSFLVQDAAQGYRWDNSQCTLHPFVFYFKGEDSNLKHESFCFFSDGTKDTTAMFFTFLKKLVSLLRNKYPKLAKDHLLHWWLCSSVQESIQFYQPDLPWRRLWNSCRMELLCHFPWQKWLWWNMWNIETLCVQSKSATSIKGPDPNSNWLFQLLHWAYLKHPMPFYKKGRYWLHLVGDKICWCNPHSGHTKTSSF